MSTRAGRATAAHEAAQEEGEGEEVVNEQTDAKEAHADQAAAGEEEVEEETPRPQAPAVEEVSDRDEVETKEELVDIDRANTAGPSQ